VRSVRFRGKREIEKHLRNFKRSGLSVTAYSQENNLPASTFFNWQKRGKTRTEEQPSFARLTLSGVESLQYEIQRKDITIRVPLAVDEPVLRRLLSLLSEVS
jgi:hypothetical protein